MSKSITNEFDYKEDILKIFDAFDTPTIRFEKASRQYYLFVCIV